MRLTTAIFSLLVLLALACGNSRPAQAPRTATAVRVIMPTSEPTEAAAPVATESPTEATAPTSLPPAASVPEYDLVGTQGMFNFVIVDKSLDADKGALKGISDTICSGQQICAVLFWDDESKAATGVPMTDAQVEAKVAQYNLNTNTNLDRLVICAEEGC